MHSDACAVAQICLMHTLHNILHYAQVVPPSEWGFLDTFVLFTFGVVHPGSSFKVIWDVYVMAILFTVLIATPFVICFDIQYARISALGMYSHILHCYAHASVGCCM